MTTEKSIAVTPFTCWLRTWPTGVIVNHLQNQHAPLPDTCSTSFFFLSGLPVNSVWTFKSWSNKTRTSCAGIEAGTGAMSHSLDIAN